MSRASQLERKFELWWDRNAYRSFRRGEGTWPNLKEQVFVDPYYIDFEVRAPNSADTVKRFGIEIDGALFHTDPARELVRKQHIEASGWTLYRISDDRLGTVGGINDEILKVHRAYLQWILNV